MKAHWPISILSTLSSLISMALPLILVRSLNPATLGSFKIFFLYLMVLPPLTFIAGVSSGLSYWAGRGEEGKKAIRVSGILFILLACLSLAIMLAIKIPLSHSLNVGADWISLFAYALFFAIASMFYDDAAIATGRIWTGAIFNSGFELVRTGAIVLTAVMTHDLYAIIKAHIFVQMIKTITGYLLAYHQDLFRFEWSPEVFRSVARYAFPVSLAFVFGLWLNYSDQIILSKTITAAEFALYTVCCLTVPPLLVLEASVTRVLIPQLSEAFAENEQTRATKLFRKAVNELSFLVIPAVFGMILFATPIIQLLFTKTYVGGAPYLRLYALWYLTLLIPQDAIARAQGQAKWILGNFIFFACFTLALCFGFGHFFGATGVLSGLLLARFISRAYTTYYMKSSLQWKVRDFIPFASMGKMTLICVGLSVVSFFMKPLFQSELAWFFAAGGIFLVAYLGFGFSLLSEERNQNTKVLMLTPGLFIGGLERMILNLSKSLKSNSLWEPQVLAYDFAPAAGGASDLISAFQSLEIPVHAKIKPPRFSIKTAAHIAGMVSREGVTVIHTHDLGALIYGAIAKCFLFSRVKLVHTQHSFVHLNRSWKYRYYERFFTLFANSIAVVSEDTENSYRKLGVPSGKLHVIPNGVDFPEFPDLDRGLRIQERSSLLKSLPVHSRVGLNDYWIVYLARIHGRKGQDQAIKLWRELDPALRKNCALLFVGPETEAGEWARIEALIKEAPDSEKMVLAGPSLNPNEWLRVADVYLSSSEFEGMPLSPVEAIGSGIPALLSDIPGHAFLKPYARTYSLLDPKSGASLLAEILAEIFKDDVKLRNETWNRSAPLRANYTLATMSGQYEKLYGPKT
jgi:glycosyltransferase involved in cell wall biosynthesis/O-antigen/teichoic acid export membrane protein